MANELRLASAGMKVDAEDWEKRAKGVERLLRVGLGFVAAAAEADDDGKREAALSHFVEGLKGMSELICVQVRRSLAGAL